MSTDFRIAPIDPISHAALAASGLRLGLVDTSDRTAFAAWVQADVRGFHGAELETQAVEESMDAFAYRRTTGVWDAQASPETSAPVGTVNSWPTPLTVPGRRTVDAWAISSVTVAPTHRRRGIARNLLEAELRTAASLSVPLAILTVSESTIYSRFGFAAAAFSSTVTIDARRAGWQGPHTTGTLNFIPTREFRELVGQQHERLRLSSPGQIEVWGMRWDQLAGLTAAEKEKSKNLRAVRYDDAEGTLRGLMLYRVSGGEVDFSAHTLTVEYLSSETDEAYAALWRYALEVDLVAEVVADGRSVEEAVLWQIADRRAAKVAAWDHLWARILDVAGSLQARSYAGPARLGFQLSDDLGFTSGLWLLDIGQDGEGRVTQVDALPEDAASLALTVNELSALYLGGASATTLRAAGRLSELTPDAAISVDRAFRAARAPWLSVWF